jgi:NAD(P)-dependent dehydrogenase (short-subunit alcohol dehydrogenase family)
MYDQNTQLIDVSVGARVVVACRSLERGNAAVERMRAEVSGAQARVVQLDLASLKSVKQCAEELLASESAIHLLINNAGQ